MNRTAAIYTRQSRTDDSKKDKQKREQHVETTLDTQAAACKRDAVKRGYQVTADGIFSERYTGAEMWDRPILSELRRRIKAREYAALFVYSTDRLARDPIHLALILEECQRVSCELVFVTEPLEDSPEGELILYIKGYAAKIERLRIKDRMARGRNAITAAGKLTCQGNPPYGYQFDTTNRVRVIDEAPAQVVRDIFRWTIEGKSAHAIAALLRQMGLPSPAEYHGKTFKHTAKPIWGNSTVSRILADETYTGKTHVGKHKVQETRNKKSGRYFSERVDRSTWKELPTGVTPAIVTLQTYQAARRAVAKNVRGADFTRNEKRPVLLRGLIFCGDCECAMYPMSETTHKPASPNRQVYRCSFARLKKGLTSDSALHVCRAKRLYADKIEDAVWNKVVSFFINPETVKQEVERAMSAMPDTELEHDLTAAQTRLEAARRLRATFLAKFETATAEDDDEMAAIYDDKLRGANDDVKGLAALVADLESRLRSYKHAGKAATALAKQIAQVMRGLNGEFTFDEKRAALQALNARVFAVDGKPTRIRLTLGAYDDADTDKGNAVSKSQGRERTTHSAAATTLDNISGGCTKRSARNADRGVSAYPQQIGAYNDDTITTSLDESSRRSGQRGVCGSQSLHGLQKTPQIASVLMWPVINDREHKYGEDLTIEVFA